MRKILLAIFICSVVTACNNVEKSGGTTTKNEEIVRKYFDYFNRHDWVNMANMYSEIAEFKDPSFGQKTVTQTRQQIVEKYTELSTMFPDVKDQIIQIYPSGERHVVVEFESTGTAPDSSKFNLPVCTVFTIEDERIPNDFTYYDNFEGTKD